MTIKEFIEAAIEGGWKGLSFTKNIHIENPERNEQMRVVGTDGDNAHYLHLSNIVIDPEAWKAVGKVKGWVDHSYIRIPYAMDKASDYSILYFNGPEWKGRMIYMMYKLDSGQTLEEYISTL